MPRHDAVTEPAYSILYHPQNLEAAKNIPDMDLLLKRLENNLSDPLNAGQKLVFEKSFSERVTLLWGPPGTGKSKTLGSIILGWLENAELENKKVRMAVGSSNWTAIDNLLSVITEAIKTREDRIGKFTNKVNVYRVGGKEETEESENSGVIYKNLNEIDAADDLYAEMREPTSCDIIGGTWKQLNKLVKQSYPNFKNVEWFDLVLIDESSQVKVSQAAQYLLMMKNTGNIIFAGDDKQLGPINKFQMSDDKNGLFDCIFTFMKNTHKIKPVSITDNYRSNTQITQWPKERFYSDGFTAINYSKKLDIKLPAEKPEYWNDQLIWDNIYLEILNPDMPIVVITYPESTYTVSNPFESQLVTAISHLYKNSTVEEIDDKTFFDHKLGIVTPHRAQKSNIQNQLISYAGFPNTATNVVDTVDRFQGQERDLIIASYVVSDKDFVTGEEDFILDSRRFNVSLTRAKSKFILIISDAILTHLPNSTEVAKDASHIQLFVEEYCKDVKEMEIQFYDENREIRTVKCKLKGVYF